MEQSDIPTAILAAKAFAWDKANGRMQLLLKELVKNGLDYCAEISKQHSGTIAAIWEFDVGTLDALVMVAMRHLNGVQVVPELQNRPLPLKLAGMPADALHAELARMRSRTSKMQGDLNVMLAELRDFGDALGNLAVAARSIA